ncbi:MAG TPA: CBS domain-containing protein [Gammaproteobacteria bacterium]|nr:CBS domain-containing protein [Gammaproteobacteria bacterium]
MKLSNIIVKTATAGAGMTVGDVFRECTRCHVPGIPWADEDGRLAGCILIRETILQICIPEYLVAYADLLGDRLGCMTVPEEHARQVLLMPAERFIIRDYPTIDSDSPVVKAVAVMEKHETHHVFVVDDGNYRGIVTIDGIARRMLEVGEA